MESLKGLLTEEQARELLNDIRIAWDNLNRDSDQDNVITRWKERGYIKENPVEKAKKLIKDISKGIENDNFDKLTFKEMNVPEVLSNAIKYLEIENRIKELEGKML
jgi:hypothetical protein